MKTNDMNNKELVEKIHDFILKVYKAKYTGRLEVTNKDGMYILLLGVPSPDFPTTISLQTNDPEEFLNYIEDELKNRDYMRVYYYSIKRKEQNEIQQERRRTNKYNK